MNAADLLARYAARRDAEAFATLVSDYQSMVLATCRRRVRSPADVDDAVQETFLKLAKNAGSLRANVAAWLHRCAVNVSADLNRRGETRRRHESAAPVADDAGIGAQRELAELREQLDAALDRLDERDRELILERFFVGRSQVDIAKEEGVSPSAISQRLDRAIDALRGHLAASGVVIAGGGLAALLSTESASAAVAPAMTAQLNAIGLAGAPTPGVVAAGAGTWAAIAATIAVAGAAVGATLWFQRQAAMPLAGVVATPTATQTAGGLTIRGDAPVDAAPPPPAWTAPAAAPAGVLSGRITDADGKPVAGASVVLSNVRSGPVTTDADGRYAFATVPSEGEYRLAVTADGFAPLWGDYSERDVPLRLAPGAQAQRDVVLQRAVSVTVVVEDAGGAALENLRVTYVPMVDEDSEAARRTIDRPAGVTEEGIATIAVPVGATPYAIMATAKDRAPQFVRVVPAKADEPMNLPITLERGVTVAGTALCNDGKPATGWSISARPVDWPWRNYPAAPARIDADGKFTLKNAMPGAYEISFSIPSGPGMWTGRTIGRFEVAADKPLDVAIPMKSPGALAKITGKVKWVGDVSADPYVSVAVSPLDNRSDNHHHSSLRYDRSKGREQTFTIENIEPGEYRVRVEGPNLVPVNFDRVKIPGELPEIELRVAKPSQLGGIVANAATGGPVANFAFRLRKLRTIGNGPNYQPSHEWTQVGDADGAFTTDVTGPGEYQVQISAPGHAWTWSEPTRIETPGASGTVEVKLSRGGGLRGVVRDAAGRPVAGAKVIPFSMAQSPVVEHGDVSKRFAGEAGAVVTDAEGRYELKHLPPGNETLKVVHADFAPTQIEGVKVVEGATGEAPAATLTPGATIAGTVYDADGRPAPNVTIQFQDRYAYNGDEEAGRITTATTDGEGKYRVTGVRGGQMLYANLADRWQRSGVGRRPVRAIEGRDAALDFGGAGALSGRLLDRAGAPHGGDVVVTLSSGDRHFGAFIATAKPDAEGRFSIRGVPPGRYLLYADSPRGRDRMPMREVTVGDAPLDLGDLADDRGRASLVVSAADPAALAAVERVLLTADPATAGWELPIGQFRREGERWVSEDVPVGRSLARLYSKEHGLLGQAVIDRKPGEAEQTVAYALSERSAKIRYVPATQPTRGHARLLDEAGVAWLQVGGDKAFVASVPPGTYRFAGPRALQPLADVPPVVARAGETVDIAVPGVPPQAGFQLYVWSADGQLRSDATVTLTDAGGHVVPPVPWLGHERAVFAVAPGEYTARVEVPGRPVTEQPIDVPADVNPLELADQHVTLPD